MLQRKKEKKKELHFKINKRGAKKIIFSRTPRGTFLMQGLKTIIIKYDSGEEMGLPFANGETCSAIGCFWGEKIGWGVWIGVWEILGESKMYLLP